jgi:sensor domain CHASE-containing protein
MHEAVKSRLNSWDACCNSVQNLSSHWLNKNLKIRIYGTVILCVVFYVCETPSVTLRKNILRVFGNRVLRQIFGAEREEVTGDQRRMCSVKCHDV